MDVVGSLELSWAQGYNGSTVSYIDDGVYCFVCGKSIKFLGEDGSENLFPFPGEGMGPMAVHAIHKNFAVASQGRQPKIYVYSYPTFEEVSVLQGGAKLGFSHVVFSTTNYMLTVSTLPDFVMSLWLYTKSEMLASVNLSHQTPTSVTFNPADWRQLCVTSDTNMTVWEIEQCDTHFTFIARDVGEIAADAMVGSRSKRDQDNPTRASTRMTAFSVDIPKPAKAGLVGSMAERLDQLQDETEKVKPVSHAWAPNGDVYIGCQGGQLILVDGESWQPTVLYNPQLLTSSFPSREPSNISLTQQHEPGIPFGEGSLGCMRLHRRGLFVAGDDGVIRLVDVTSEALTVTENCHVGFPITSMDFSQGYDKVVIGSSQGSIHLYEPGRPDGITELLDIHYSSIVGLGMLASGGDTCVTVREDGELQLWNVETGRLTGSMPVGIQCTALAVSPMCHYVTVGTATGHIYAADCTDPGNVRLVHRTRIHNGPVLHLKFDQLGNLLLSASEDSHVFVLDGRPSEKLKVLGYTDVKGHVQNIATYSEPKKGDVRVVVACSNASTAAANKLFSFEISETLRNDPSLGVGNLKGEFRVTSINKMECVVKPPVHGVAVTAEGDVYALGSNKKIYKYTLPMELLNRKVVTELEAEEVVPAHLLPGGSLYLSPHQKWLASCGTDGLVTVRSVLAMDRSVSVQPASFSAGGVQSVIFSDDGTRLLTLGKDSSIICYKWQFSPQGVSRAKSALESSRARRSRLLHRQQEQDGLLQEMADWAPSPPSSRAASAVLKEEKEQLEKEKAIAADEIYTTPTPTAGSNATWLECREIEAHKEEDKQYTTVKNDLRVQIRDMRRTIQGMMRNNEALPELEKLSHHEFDLDIEEQVRLQAEGEAHLQKIREEIEFENLAKMYLRDRIKRECWDQMEVKGRSILAFNSNLEVSNFPLKTRSKEALKMLDMVTKRRQVEMMDMAARKEMAELGRKPNSAFGQRFTTGPAEDEGAEMDESEDSAKEQPSITGSLGCQYGGENPLLQSQFELHSREQKLTQVILLEDTIHSIKKAFNKEFEDGFAKKEQEISKIKEKNKRIVKILQDLELNESCVEPELSSMEKPELLLTVNDEEVTVERFLTAEQRKEKEQQERLEEERRAKERGDNVRDRALGMMMGGVLEIKKEDELKKDIPVPAFMKNKAQDEWNEEEVKVAKEFERKVKELEDEREKYRKQLETELRKLQATIHEGMAAYDEGLNKLFMRKVRTQMVIYQEELKMLRLRYSLLIEEELELRENQLNRLLEQKRAKKQVSGQRVGEIKSQVDHAREQHDTMLAEDKVMEKAFKREFSDCTALQVEQLFKLFKKRPRGQKLKGDTPILDPNSPNPFAERPSTARKESQARAAMDAFLEEADKETNMPENVEPSVWERMCHYRREKVHSELTLKSKMNTVSEMNAFLNRRQEEDDMLKSEIDDIVQDISKVKEDQLRFTCNLEVQLLLKQGQVEIDPGSFIPDFKDSVLLHRNVIEDLNNNIKQLGESKISSMVESKDFRKGILQLEWEHKRMLMQIEDLDNKMKDIQFMKVTREIQMFLNEGDYDGKKSQEVSVLEQTLQLLQTHHDRKVKDKKRMTKELNSTIKQKRMDNNRVSAQLEELNVSLNERIHIDEVNADQRMDTGAEKRYREIVQRRKLVDLAKAQAQEVAVLRAEVERLRMRTFPALVQVER